MSEPNKIGGINVAAPLWNKANESELRAIVTKLDDASYHYADDSAREWGKGDLAKEQAAAEVNRLMLSTRAIEALYTERQQLVSRENFMDAILKNARAKARGQP